MSLIRSPCPPPRAQGPEATQDGVDTVSLAQHSACLLWVVLVSFLTVSSCSLGNVLIWEINYIATNVSDGIMGERMDD